MDSGSSMAFLVPSASSDCYRPLVSANSNLIRISSTSASFGTRSFDLVPFRESGNSALGHDEPASRRECNCASCRETTGNFPDFGRSRRKYVPKTCANSAVCEPLEHEFPVRPNRESIRPQQGIQFVQQRVNSTEQGIDAKSIFARRARTIPSLVVPPKAAFAGRSLTFMSAYPL
jgi:hypothetical protein